jgi:hypothetical protein
VFEPVLALREGCAGLRREDLEGQALVEKILRSQKAHEGSVEPIGHYLPS